MLGFITLYPERVCIIEGGNQRCEACLRCWWITNFHVRYILHQIFEPIKWLESKLIWEKLVSLLGKWSVSVSTENSVHRDCEPLTLCTRVSSTEHRRTSYEWCHFKWTRFRCHQTDAKFAFTCICRRAFCSSNWTKQKQKVFTLRIGICVSWAQFEI